MPSHSLKLKTKSLRTARGFGQFIFNLLLPPVCLNCRASTTDHNQLCSNCWSDIDFFTDPICAQTGAPLSFHFALGDEETILISKQQHFDRAIMAGRYDGVLKDLIHKMKYNDRLDVVPLLAHWQFIAGRSLLKDVDIILPVPLHKKRLFSRRFNQSALLAKQLYNLALKADFLKESSQLNLEIVERVRATVPQVGLTSEQRHKNIKGAFHIRSNAASLINDQVCLLIDDVITTGATVNEMALLLKKKGARKVYVLAVAGNP